ncbi:MAG: type I-F CRISPR-associated protein Cas7f/Csy3 [Comamonas sp.]
MSNTLKTASVLAFERKLDPSDAIFSAGHWNDQGASWVPVKIKTKSIRGTISNRLKTKDQDPAKLDAAIQNPNLQTVDVAALPTGTDTLKVQFTLRVLAGAGTPSACNSADYQVAANCASLCTATRLYRAGKPLRGQSGQWPLSVA